MKLDQVGALGGDPVLLRTAWSARSLDRAWLKPHDWYSREVDAVTERIAAGLDPMCALEELGAARAGAGVGLDEALRDLRCLAEIVGPGLDPWESALALSRGWNDATARRRLPAPVIDPATDLATLPYLAVRLRELYDAAPPARQGLQASHCLIVVDTATACTDPWQRFHRGIVLGEIMHQLFKDGSSLVSLGECSGAALALVKRSRALGATTRRVKSHLNKAMAQLQQDGVARHPVRVWVEQLPTTYDQALALLADLAR
jgi:hypothetical protein